MKAQTIFLDHPFYPCPSVAQLFENLAESLFVKPNNQLLPDPQNGRAERSRPAKNHSRNFVLVVVLFQIEMDELLSFPHIKIFHPVQQLERAVAIVTDFPSVDFLDRVDTVVRKKLLRFFTGHSARSVITPVNLRHLLFLF